VCNIIYFHHVWWCNVARHFDFIGFCFGRSKTNYYLLAEMTKMFCLIWRDIESICTIFNVRSTTVYCTFKLSLWETFFFPKPNAVAEEMLWVPLVQLLILKLVLYPVNWSPDVLHRHGGQEGGNQLVLLQRSRTVAPSGLAEHFSRHGEKPL